MGLFDFTTFVIKKEESGGRSNSFATLFRMVRLLRILRIIKIIRFLKQLYLLAYGFVDGVQAIMWVTLLMSFVLYICAIILVRTYTHTTLADDPAHDLLW